MAELLKLPLGEEFLAPLIRNGFYYVDKTQMLADFLRSRGSVNLFTRPRRFGKSLTIDMFKSFFEIGSDPAVFEGLAISREKDICNTYMGKYPVISISLKGVEASSYEKAVRSMSSVIGAEARRHSYLLDSDRLSEVDKLMLRELYVLRIEEDVQRDSLRLLSEMLTKHHGRKVILLIDEYDVPLDKAWQNGYYDEMVGHIRTVFGNSLKTNPYLEFAVITGCLRIARESIFTGINNFTINTISDMNFASCFGFTEQEVLAMLDYYGLSEKAPLFKEWYDGYRFGNVEIYCPWDVINQAAKLLADPGAPMEPHWINSSSNYIVRDLLRDPSEGTQAEIELLISGEAVTKELMPELTYKDLTGDDEELRETYLWSVLYSTGYLTDAPSSQSTGSDRLHRLVIPNKEIRMIYELQIRSWFRQKTKSRSKEWEAFCSSILAGDVQAAQNLLNGFMEESISIRDTFIGKQYKENFYHGLLLGLLKGDGRWLVRSNTESGTGYPDISLWAPSKKTGCIIEVKYAENGAFEAALDEAMRQIEDQDYVSSLRLDGAETIRKYGIAFYKKTCRVRYRE